MLLNVTVDICRNVLFNEGKVVELELELDIAIVVLAICFVLIKPSELELLGELLDVLLDGIDDFDIELLAELINE